MGTTLSATRTITSEDIAACARLTGDIGSHHVSGLAGKQMSQGLLTLALAPLFMRDGVHMSELSIKFLAPVFAGDTVTATVEIVDMAEDSDGLHILGGHHIERNAGHRPGPHCRDMPSVYVGQRVATLQIEEAYRVLGA